MPTTRDDEIRALLGRKRFNEAFELAISAYGNRMLGLAFSILGDRAEAEDAVQDVMVRIWKALPQFRGDSAMSTWIGAVRLDPHCLADVRQRIAAAEPVSRISKLPEWLDFAATCAICVFGYTLATQTGLLAYVIDALPRLSTEVNLYFRQLSLQRFERCVCVAGCLLDGS